MCPVPWGRNKFGDAWLHLHVCGELLYNLPRFKGWYGNKGERMCLESTENCQPCFLWGRGFAALSEVSVGSSGFFCQIFKQTSIGRDLLSVFWAAVAEQQATDKLAKLAMECLNKKPQIPSSEQRVYSVSSGEKASSSLLWVYYKDLCSSVSMSSFR